MNKQILIAMIFMIAMLATMKISAQTTDITVYYRSNPTTDVMQDVKKFYFEGENVVFKLGDGATTSIAMSSIKKMTLAYNEPPFQDIEDISANEGFYPNPTSDMIYFNFNVDSEVSLQIFSSTGQLVMEKMLSSDGAVDVSSLSEGLYIVKINDRTYKFSKL